MLAPTHDVVIATSGKEALAAVAADRFDAIVCDVMMPEMTGMDLYARLLEQDRRQAECVIFMTGGAFVPRVAEFLTKVENTTLEKPFQLAALEAALRDVRQRAAAISEEDRAEDPRP
jgi:CheY-like chemotaxis protein